MVNYIASTVTGRHIFQAYTPSCAKVPTRSYDIPLLRRNEVKCGLWLHTPSLELHQIGTITISLILNITSTNTDSIWVDWAYRLQLERHINLPLDHPNFLSSQKRQFSHIDLINSQEHYRRWLSYLIQMHHYSLPSDPRASQRACSSIRRQRKRSRSESRAFPEQQLANLCQT